MVFRRGIIGTPPIRRKRPTNAGTKRRDITPETVVVSRSKPEVIEEPNIDVVVVEDDEPEEVVEAVEEPKKVEPVIVVVEEPEEVEPPKKKKLKDMTAEEKKAFYKARAEKARKTREAKKKSIGAS